MKKTTERGFAIYGETKDSRGQAVRVQHSSEALVGPRAWITVYAPPGEDTCQQGVGGEHHGQTARAPGGGLKGCICRSAYLDVEQAKQIRDALNRFIRGAK